MDFSTQTLNLTLQYNKVQETCTKVRYLLEEIYQVLRQLPPELIDHGPIRFHSSQNKNRTKLMLTMKRLSLHISSSVIVCSLIYVDRLSSCNNFFLTRKNSFKLIMTALLISEKFLSDQPILTKTFTKFSKLSSTEMVDLEMEFLKLINYDLCVSNEEYESYLENLYKKTESSISSDDIYDFFENDSD